MIKVYFVRHAQPEYGWKDDRSRPLTPEGKEDAKQVVEFFKEMEITRFYCSPYKRSIDTIADTAANHHKEIILLEGLRERANGTDGGKPGMIEKRWADFSFHEEGGESIGMVQERNMKALLTILKECEEADDGDMNIVIGTHGTALSSILQYYDRTYNSDSFFRMVDWMPYIIELDFEANQCIGKKEHLYIQKEFTGINRIKPIETSRLSIRRFKEGDGEDLFEYLSDPQVVAFEPYDPYTREQAIEEAKNRSGMECFYAVCLKDNGKVIGNIYLNKGDFDTWELGYVFNAKYQGKGYATEAAKELINRAFRDWGARRVIAMCSPRNEPSWHLLERLGMRREGTLLENVYFKCDKEGQPIWLDTYEYGILKREWMER